MEGGGGRQLIAANSYAAGVSRMHEAAPQTASRQMRSSDRRAAKRAEAGLCVGRAADRLKVDVDRTKRLATAAERRAGRPLGALNGLLSG